MTVRGKVWLEPLRESSQRVRKVIFLQGPDNAVLTICELALNYLSGNIKPKLTKIQQAYTKLLAERNLSLHRKRKFLGKPQGLKLAKALLHKSNI